MPEDNLKFSHRMGNKISLMILSATFELYKSK